MTFILETGQYFGTFQNGIENKQSGTEGVQIFTKSMSKTKIKQLSNGFSPFL